MLKDFLLKKMLKQQLKGMPEDQQEQIVKMVENNPELFNKIAAEIQEKVKGGMDQQAAALQVMQAHKDELRKAMGK